MEEKINTALDNQEASENINANRANDVDTYYQALKKIEKVKSRKKRIGCLIVLLIPIILLAINVIPQLLAQRRVPSEKMNLCEIYRAEAINRVRAEEKYVKNEDGVYYRYKFVAKIVSIPDENVDVVVLCPECYDNGGFHTAKIRVSKDLARDLKKGDWIMVDDASIPGIIMPEFFTISTDTNKIKKITYSEALDFIESK